MHLTNIGKIVKDEIEKTNKIRENIKISPYVIMPDHIHFILQINSEYGGHGAPCPYVCEKFGKPTHNTVPTIVRYLKSGVTRTMNKKYNGNFKIWRAQLLRTHYSNRKGIL